MDPPLWGSFRYFVLPGSRPFFSRRKKRKKQACISRDNCSGKWTPPFGFLPLLCFTRLPAFFSRAGKRKSKKKKACISRDNCSGKWTPPFWVPSATLLYQAPGVFFSRRKQIKKTKACISRDKCSGKWTPPFWVPSVTLFYQAPGVFFSRRRKHISPEWRRGPGSAWPSSTATARSASPG